MRVGFFPALFILLAAISLASCSKAGGKSDLSELTYSLARTATNTTTNALYLQFSKADGYSFLIEGEGFDADILFGQRVDVREVVNLAFASQGTYSLILKVFYGDGSIMVQDLLSWQYSLEEAPDPLVTFSEEATNDQEVSLVMPIGLDSDVKELWVEGDVISSDRGWHAISNSKVLVHTTKDDGMKNMTVKYRNIFGSESTTQDLEILKKSVGPTDCATTINTLVTGNGKVVIHFEAINDGPLYYLLSGDMAGATGQYVSFDEAISVSATIIDNDNPNKIKAQLRDIAGNICPAKTFSVTYDENHESFTLDVEGGLLTTDDEDITILPQIDFNPADEVLMYIHGDIEASADTFNWIPYTDSVDVTLTQSDGNRFVRVKYQLNGDETSVKSRAIYLKPFIQVNGASAPYTMVLSEIVDLDTITVTGCVESYQNVTPVASVSCTPNAVNISVDYHLTDGTTVTKSVAAPP